MDKNMSEIYYSLIRSLGQFLALSRLYNRDHPVSKEKAKQVFAEINTLMLNKQSLNLSEVEGIFLVNGEKIEIKDILTKHFVESFRNLQLGSLDLEPGLDIGELEIFIQLLNQTEHLRGEDRIKDYFKGKKVKHIIPRFVTYKLVREDEKVVKDSGVIYIDELPVEVRNRFAQDVNKGEVGERINKEEKAYQLLAHDPIFLSGFIFDLTKKSNTPEELTKILWSIGEYLIEEISGIRQEEINRKILNELKDRLFSLWEQREDKMRWREETQKALTAISAALELKGLTLLYKRHKKGLEGVLNKIKEILESIPSDSQLYKKTKENLAVIGPPSFLDSDIFNK